MLDGHITLRIVPLPELLLKRPARIDFQLPVVHKADGASFQGSPGGPSKGIPSTWNPLPWQGHLNRFSLSCHMVMQPRCVQAVRRA